MTFEEVILILLVCNLLLIFCFCLSRKLFVKIWLVFFFIALVLSYSVWLISPFSFITSPFFITLEAVAIQLGFVINFLFVITTFRLLRTDVDVDVDTSRVQRLKVIFLGLGRASPTMDVIDQLLIAKMSQDAESENRLLIQLAMEDKSPEVRLVAIQQLTNQPVLSHIVRDTTIDRELRKAALERLHDQVVLSQVARYIYTCEDLRKAALERIHDQATLLQFASDASINEDLRKVALERIHDQASLAAFVRGEQNVNLCLQAVKRLSDPVLLQEISREVTNAHIKQLATAKLELLNATVEERLQIAREESDDYRCAIAITMITNQDHLFEIANYGRKGAVRIAAIKRLQRKEDLENILKIAENSEIYDVVKKRLQELQ